MLKLAHLTSVHPRYDTRIFLKECCSLAVAGYDISLVVADGLPDEIKSGVKIYGVKKENKRFSRMLKSPKRVYKKALELNADIYHLHDPELLPIGLKLKKKGKKVIFDSHEDYPAQILSKPYLNKFILSIISKIYSSYERNVLIKYDYIIAATPFIKEKISQWHPAVIDINNYPLLEEFSSITRKTEQKGDIPYVCYVGGISEIRGIKEMVKAMEYCVVDVRLKLVGDFASSILRDEVRNSKGWEQIDELGFLDRKGVSQIFEQSLAGIIVYLPLPNHIDAQPNKLFEYMSAGLPVITSNFPLWEKIVEENKCGICVNPNKPEEIALAIDFIVNNNEQALTIGANGKKAIYEKYNWNIEKERLLNVYSTVKG